MSLNHLSVKSEFDTPYLKSGELGPTGPTGPAGPPGPLIEDPDFNSVTIQGKPVATIEYVDEKWNSIGNWQPPVISRLLNPPPELHTGDRYLVIPGSLDFRWADYGDNIITYITDDDFVATTPTDGMVVFAQDTDFIWLYNGTEWVRLSVEMDHNNLLNIQGGNTTERYHIDAATSANLIGITSPVQTQLNNRIITNLTTSASQNMNGEILMINGYGTLRLGNFGSTYGNGIIFRNTQTEGSIRRFDMGLRNDGTLVFRIGPDQPNNTSPLLFRYNGDVTFPTLTAGRALYVDGSNNLRSSSVTNLELSYLSGVTSSIQTQINTKMNFNDYFRPLNTNSVLVYDYVEITPGVFGSRIYSSTVTINQLNNLNGSTSNLQNQINNLQNQINNLIKTHRFNVQVVITAGVVSTPYVYPSDCIQLIQKGGTNNSIISVVYNSAYVPGPTPPIVTVSQSFGPLNNKLNVTNYIDTTQFTMITNSGAVDTWDGKNCSFMFTAEITK